MDKEKLVENLAIWGGPLGLALYGIYTVAKSQDQSGLNEDKRNDISNNINKLL